MKINKIVQDWPKNRLLVNYNIHNVCNYKCWYCHPTLHDGSNRWPDLDLVTKNVIHLLSYYKDQLGKDTIEFHLLGGEPTIWPQLTDFVRALKAEYGSNIMISMTTNGSRTLNWWKEHGEYFDKVLISCHPDQVDPAHIIEVADLLYEKDILVDTMVLMDPPLWSRCIDIINELSTSQHKWSVQVSRVIHDTVSYTAEQEEYLKVYMKRMLDLEWFRRVNKAYRYTVEVDGQIVDKNYIVFNKLNSFYNWSCNIGIDNISIYNDGTLSGQCGEYLYGLDFKYNLYSANFAQEFSPELTPALCKKLSCICQHEWNTTKHRIIRIHNGH